MTSEVAYFPEALASPSEEPEDLLRKVFISIFRRTALFGASSSTDRSWIVDVPHHRTFERRRNPSARPMGSHLWPLGNVRRVFIELCVNPYPRTHNILINATHNQRQMADLIDYNVAHKSQNNPKYPRKHIHFISGFGAL